MGAATSTSVSLLDDAACEAVLRTFIGEDLERAERLLRRADELIVEARRSQSIWTVHGLDGTTLKLPVSETATVRSLSKSIATRIGMRAGAQLVLFAGGEILEDSNKPLHTVDVCSREISYFVRQVGALEAAISFRGALAQRTFDHTHATVTDAIACLTFGDRFNHSLVGVSLPRSLQSLTFGENFNQSLQGVTLPNSLQALTFGDKFNQSLECVTLPSSLLCLTFGHQFNQSLEGVILPSSLRTLTFGGNFNESLEGVTLCLLAKQPEDVDLRSSVQPEFCWCHLAKQPPDFDPRQQF
ncbi:Probable inactive serine/threonine-protein kinase fnkC [Durusdinium trenchii]|uniref:Probable inactive serine/threonine-protein kinase fnkC n=1 Tax=Durusdinium trenchii TaxID=1381693 RepID=A0ABP0MUQ4_9DINO